MKRRAWLLAALVLLACAAVLMWRGESKEKPAPAAHVEFPRFARPEEHERNQQRRTLAPAPVKDDAQEGVRLRRDPVMIALPTTKGKSAMVFEAAALKDSPVGRLWLDCMMSERDAEQVERLKNEHGVDVLHDVDRVAASSQKVVVLAGDFSKAHWDDLGRTKRGYGNKGTIYANEDGKGGKAIATWGDGIQLMGDITEIEAAIDRLEDRTPPEPPLIPEWAAYGDAYGVVSAEDFARMLPESQRDIGERLRGALERIELHVDASEDVAIVADATGPTAADVDDLGKTLGAALSLGRLKAQSDGDEKLAELMELARVSPRNGRFSLELALPMPLIQRQMGPCKRQKEKENDKEREKDAGP
jgi:hypothetical protein